ncbi:MAG: hypothetical protein JXA66_03675 [Oligoflexia bacterium]|nr:hypothetical protein [Oligoflexia bacterium]
MTGIFYIITSVFFYCAADTGKLPNNDHPDYPSRVVLQLMENKASPDEVISKLEPVITQTNFIGLSDTGEQESKLLVGTPGSFVLWRELIYIKLGRAYYAKGNFEKAIYYYGGIPKDSPYALLAGIEKIWALLNAGQYKTASKIISENLKKNLPDFFKKEARLEQAYVFYFQKDYKKTMDILSGLSFVKGDVLRSLWLKLFIQAEFEDYLELSANMAIDAKKNILSRIISRIDELDEKSFNPATAFLCGDVYWNYSSLLRIEDPQKNEEKWKESLQKADAILKPWINSLSEEAMFLSVAVLWEQDKKEEAIPRLKRITEMFPQGKYREDSYQLMADYYYNEGNFKKALKYYRKLAKIGSKTKAAYGVYKAAWAFYNLQKKWGALRHLERLVSFYKSEEKGSLSNESEKDMLTVLAELTPYHDALSELNIFKYDQKELLSIIEKLASSYKEIGKYDDSINTWQHLLDRYGNEPKAATWLSELLNTLLSAGKRKDIAPTLDKYIPLIALNDKLTESVARITLLINKEAKKTDDADIWAATDALYASFEKYFPGYKKGDIWLFGAQRMEMLGKKWEAVSWYKKAADIKNYEGSTDSALSVLKILKSIVDLKSLESNKPENDISEYDKVAVYSKWYIDNFKDTPQKDLAEDIYIEALYYTGKLDEIQNYILAGHLRLYNTHNKRLYRDQKWKEAYNLALAVYKSSLNLDAEFKKDIERVLQETSFQKAYVEKDRNWYLISLKYPYDKKIYIKSWHNYLLTFNIDSESPELIKEYNHFQNIYKPEEPDFEEKELLHNIYAMAIKMYSKLDMPIYKARTMVLLAKLSEDEKKFELRWDSLLLFAAYGSYADMEEQITVLQQLDPSKFSENRLMISKMYNYNELYPQAWKMLKPLIAESSPESVLLLRDIYYDTKEHDTELNGEITGFITSNQEELVKNKILTRLFFDLQYENNKKAIDNIIADLSANLENRGEKTGNEVDELKRRLEYIKTSSKLLNAYIKKINEETGNWPISMPSLAYHAISECLIIAIANFSEMKKPPLNIQEWGDFTAYLDKTVANLRIRIDDLQEQEEKLSQNPYNLKIKSPAYSPLCKGNSSCFSLKPDSDAMIETEKSWLTNPVSDTDKIISILTLGGWLKAEQMAFSEGNTYKKALLLAVIRMAKNDIWNSLPLLDKASESAELSGKAGELKKLIVQHLK